MKKNMIILLSLVCVVAVLLFLFGWLAPLIFQAFLYTPYVKSAALFLIFLILIVTKKATWQKNLVILVAVFALLGMMMDTAGNELYNKPLEWATSSIGQLKIEQNVYNYAPGEYSITEETTLLKPDGQIITISPILLYLYRFIQYLILYSAVGTLLSPVIGRLPRPQPITVKKEEPTQEEIQLMNAELDKREQEKNARRTLSTEITEQVLQLKNAGQPIRAIQVIREHTDYSIAEAKALLDQLQEEQP